MVVQLTQSPQLSKEEILEGLSLLRGDSLERALVEAPIDYSYLPDTNGFYLANAGLILRYTQRFHGGKDGLDLWFAKLNPKLNFGSEGINPRRPRSVHCTDISIHNGSTYSFSFPIGEETLENIGDTLNLSPEDKVVLGLVQADPEWFSVGTDLLRLAAKKYNLKGNYDFYQRDKNPNILDRLVQLVGL
jgi:hypothetical protein